MIKYENRFDEYAYRIAYREIDASVTALEEGQWVTFNSSGKLVVSDGSLKSFLAIGSKRTDRDQISGVPVKKIAYLLGNFELTVTNFDAEGTYAATVTPLKVTTGGILTPWATSTDKVELLVAWAIGEPSNGALRIVSV